MEIKIFPAQMEAEEIKPVIRQAKAALEGLYGSAVIRMDLDILENGDSWSITGEEFLIKQFTLIFSGLVEGQGMSQTEAFKYARRQ